ncbi:MAG: hypothetical protein WAW37_12405 [Syntrophobacteraceae bacterium]
MAFGYCKKISVTAGLAALLLVSWSVAGWCGPMKLIMTDGTSVEVPYYWVSGGEYRFDIPGGVAGIPRAQVASIQEILDAREFDPEMLMQTAGESSTADQRQLIQDLIASKSPGARCDLIDPEEGLKRLKEGSFQEASADEPKIQGRRFNLEKILPVVCDEAGGPTLVIQELLSSNADIKGREFSLILYDSEGNVISRTTCEVYPLKLDQDAQKKLQVKGQVYLVRASIKPDPKIKRYEIASVQR